MPQLLRLAPWYGVTAHLQSVNICREVFTLQKTAQMCQEKALHHEISSTFPSGMDSLQ